MNIDERIEALTMNLELAMKEIDALHKIARQDGEIHERRLTTLEATTSR